MPFVPSYCARCDKVFQDNTIFMAPGASVQISGYPTLCPSCGGSARMIDGSFVAQSDDFDIVSAPASTRRILERLREIQRQTSAGEISQEQALQEVRELDPRLGAILTRLLNVGVAVASIFATLAALVSVYYDRAAYELAEKDSADGALVNERIIMALERQAEALEALAAPKQVQVEEREQAARARPSDVEPVIEPPPLKIPSKRRAEVNKERRKALAERRRMFPRRDRQR